MHLIAKEKGLHPSLHILLRRNPSSLFLCTFRWSQPCPTLCTIPCPAICSPIKEKNPTDTHPTPFSETGTNMDDEERTAGGTVALVSGRRAADGGRSQVHAKSPDHRTFSTVSTALYPAVLLS